VADVDVDVVSGEKNKKMKGNPGNEFLRVERGSYVSFPRHSVHFGVHALIWPASHLCDV
jgi:hypothetical protein